MHFCHQGILVGVETETLREAAGDIKLGTGLSRGTEGMGTDDDPLEVVLLDLVRRDDSRRSIRLELDISVHLAVEMLRHIDSRHKKVASARINRDALRSTKGESMIADDVEALNLADVVEGVDSLLRSGAILEHVGSSNGTSVLRIDTTGHKEHAKLDDRIGSRARRHKLITVEIEPRVNILATSSTGKPVISGRAAVGHRDDGVGDTAHNGRHRRRRAETGDLGGREVVHPVEGKPTALLRRVANHGYEKK